MGADGSGGEQLIRYACGSRKPPTAELLDAGQHYMYMDGRAVFRWAVAILNDTIQDVLNDVGLTPADVDLYVPHQANIRIINAACDTLKIPREKVYTNLDRYGNTSAGSIPLAVDEALAEGRLKAGQLAILSGFGAGLTWGTALMRW
jgi:3-oxoacyl-[acyl-carrier-protein] synthase-3